MPDVIDLEAGGDVAEHNVGKLHGGTGEIPSGSAITQVYGNRSEPAPAAYTDRLSKASEVLARQVDRIRDAVALNADALSNAVATLRETDQLTANAANQATNLIDDVVAPPSSAKTRTQQDFQS